MLVQSVARRGLCLARINTLRRPQLSSRCSLQATRRLLVTRPEPLPRRRNSVRPNHGPLHERSLATAIDETLFSQSMTSSQLEPYELQSFDPSKPLLVKYSQDPYPRYKTTRLGVPGDIDAMLSVFEACMQVGKLDRAEVVLKRFGDLKPGLLAHDLIDLHNRFLRANIDHYLTEPNTEWTESLQKWYETRIRAKGLPQTPETIACMLKISLLSIREPDRLERLVKRYMGMLPGAAPQIYLTEGILSLNDVSKIQQIQNDFAVTIAEIPAEEPVETMSDDELQSSASVPSSSSEAKNGEIDEVLGVDQKGLGLETLRSVLSFFGDGEVQGRDISKLDIKERREIQSRLERDCVEAAIKRWRKENEDLMKMGRNSALSSHALNQQLYNWHTALEQRLLDDFKLFTKSETAASKTQEDLDRCMYAPFLRQSKPDRLAAVTIMSVLNTLTQHGADKGVSVSTALNHLSRAVEEDVKTHVRHKARVARMSKRSPKRVVKDEEGNVITPHTEAKDDLDDNVVEAHEFDSKIWPVVLRTKIGAVLLESLLEVAKVNVVREHPETKENVTQLQPAFTHTSITKKGKKIGVIMPNRQLVSLIKSEPRADFLARHLPMLVEPEPWTKFDKGGFLEFPASIIRVKGGEKDQKIYAEAAVDRGDMEQVSKGLDVLGRTPWKVNQPVFDVMLEVWNTGEGIADIPPLNPDLQLPPEPEASDDPMARRSWLREVKAIENEKSGIHSERCFMNFQLEIARAFKNQTFYFPHNLDFRGRAYPIPTYLNHMGADHVRGLLKFGEGKELGEKGLRWLKVHLANLYGFDKASLTERESFTTDHLDDIVDSVENPLTGKRWWTKAEDPWQCLAACFEVRAALQAPDPTKYVSHLPVHQDGTCNGLQHYAALGGDLWGAQQVNLEPGDRPADVYSAVANLVKESIAADVKANNFLGKAVDGKITRKVVKQTVMTNVYGVTFIGAVAQVKKQLDAAHPDLHAETGVPTRLLASYIATKIFKALSTMFRGAHDIQYWLGECAGRVCRALTPEQLEQVEKDNGLTIPKSRHTAGKSTLQELSSQFRSTIVWTTPLRMPVVQPYRKSEIRSIATSMQDLNLIIPERFDPVDRRKQLQAFPPNFIHSLDASHMLLSALECNALGLSFAAVHDSFWTHAGDVDVMNRVLRDSFIRIHSEDVIKRLLLEFEARYKGSLYLSKVPYQSDLEKAIRENRKKTKLSLKDELLLEVKRLRLLNSSDPFEVQQGQEMVTPTSIAEKWSTSNDVSKKIDDDDEDMTGMGLANVSEDAIEATETAIQEKAAKVQELRAGEDPEVVKAQMDMSAFEAAMAGKKKTASGARNIWVWLPLTFPELPEKGDWRVERLKTSQYFFS